MVTRIVLSAAALAAFFLGGAGVSSAMGQTQGTATWVWSVWDVGEHADGDLIIEPGEDVAVGLWLDFSPDVDGPGGPVWGFAAAAWDTLGGLNADTGWISEWQVNPDLGAVVPDQSYLDGASILDLTAGQWFNVPYFDSSDPIWIMDFIWRTDDFSPRSVEYFTLSVDSIIGVWYRMPNNQVVQLGWKAFEAQISWEIVPSPGTVAALAGLTWWTCLRRRRD
jgi:hypothetical protein